MKKSENDPTVLIRCEWEEGGYHQVETEWTLSRRRGKDNGLQRKHPSKGCGAREGQEQTKGCGGGCQTSRDEPQGQHMSHFPVWREGSSLILRFLSSKNKE